jgi:N-acetylmuramoyl-L-alanine amidase
MSGIDRMKRRLLREVVQENLDTVRGVRRTPVRRRLGAALWLLRSSLLFLPLAVFLSATLFLHGPAQGYAGQKAAVPLQIPPERVPVAVEKAAANLPVPISPALLSLAVRRIVIDPGHGGGDHGAEARGGPPEKEVALEIALQVRALLQSRAFEVVMTREADQGLTLARRADVANAAAADLFVSVHLNWIVGQPSCGVETYYLGPTDDPLLKDLAMAENRTSGYNLADFRRLFESVYVGVRQNESRHLAQDVQGNLFNSLSSVRPGLQNRGVKTAPFVVLMGTTMPGILAEVSCLSSAEEAALLRESSYRQRIAEALATGIESYARGLSKPGQKGN